MLDNDDNTMVARPFIHSVNNVHLYSGVDVIER